MYDVIFTSFPHFVERFRTAGIDTEYFRIGFDERVLGELGAVHAEHETVFVGALNGLRHRRGNRVLAARREAGSDRLLGLRPARAGRRGRRSGAATAASRGGSTCTGSWPRRGSVLNRHIADAGDHANNMRLYEATGVGSLLVTDAKQNLAELFEPGREVVTYRDADELVEQRAPLPRERGRAARDRRSRPGADAARPHVRGADGRARADARGTACDPPRSRRRASRASAS